ncbi:CheY-P phosphatase CheC [Oxobacter pfennigii]|uniref:CheY-P phosphatase CheC n=1 Tax=Oxobacter pfennigii TaxID=36849 RepID=A0A0P8YY18_9CLOT|nr:chemotaxis protein CheC [Oxobacter pfennigii]KPU44654.1 CheY-P phosphatase CheC [Oxobacter pfennigii]
MNYKDLTELQLDALREIGNIGAGNAATALSQMIQKRIDMSVPQVDILTIEDIVSKIGSEEEMVIAVVLRVLGDAPGNVMFLLTMESGYRLLELLIGGKVEGELNEYQLSAFQEIGNILTGAYLNSLVKLTGLTMISSVPAVSNDMLYPLMTTAFIESGQYDEYILSIDAKFLEGDKHIDGHFFYIPRPGSLEKLMERLGLM